MINMMTVFNITCVIICFVFSSKLIDSKHVSDQLDNFSSKCNDGICDYIVHISNQQNGKNMTSLTNQLLETQMQEMKEIIRKLANVFLKINERFRSEVTILDENVTYLQEEVSKTLLELEELKTDQRYDKLENDINELRAQFHRILSYLKGHNVDGIPYAANIKNILHDASKGLGADCTSLYSAGFRESGLYSLQPDPGNNATRFQAYCDMDDTKKGWTVIQRRVDGSEDFFRNWKAYKEGFGSLHHDFWLGLDKIHLLSKIGNTKMQIKLQDWDNYTRYADFMYVRIANESDDFRILAGGYNGNAGDPFHTLNYDLRMQGMRFSTSDHDNDLDPEGNCADTFTSGWWFSNCFIVNLNGVWYPGNAYYGLVANGIVWDLWEEHGNGYSLKKTEIKLASL